MFTFQIAPKGMRKLLNYIRDRYGDKWDIVITENGFIDSGEIMDVQRIIYIAVSRGSVQVYMYMQLIKC
jgi:beta-glucosidase/6-phospho-beta-glucosidase/beta-galactosidase